MIASAKIEKIECIVWNLLSSVWRVRCVASRIQNYRVPCSTGTTRRKDVITHCTQGIDREACNFFFVNVS